MSEESKLLSFKEAAKKCSVTLQAICCAVSSGKLKTKDNKGKKISLDDLLEYRANRWKAPRKINGELVFDNDKGYYSVHQVAGMLKINAQDLYFAIRLNRIKYTRKKHYYVLHIDDINDYKQNFLTDSFLDETD